MPLLVWKEYGVVLEAQLSEEDDGVNFTITHRPSCYRRGPYHLHVEVCTGVNRFKWGCFDEADSPDRDYHSLENAKAEAEAIARVLCRDRHLYGEGKL